MSKKIIIAGIIGVLALTGGFIALNQFEQKIENAIKEQILEFPMTAEDISYNALSNTVNLDNVIFEIKNQGVNIFLNASKVSITDLNTDIVETEELPLLFGELSIKDLKIDVKNKNQEAFNLSFDSFIMQDYAYNVAKIMEQYEREEWSEEFFEVLLNYKHNGMEITGYKFASHENYTESPIQASIEKIVVDPVENPLFYSVSYENMETTNEFMTFNIGIFNIDNLQIPSAKKLADLAEYIEFMGADHLMFIVDQTFTYTESAPFTNITLKEMKLLVTHELTKDIKNKEISLENFSIDSEFGDKATFEYTLENFVISPEYIALFDYDKAAILQAFIPENIVINFSNKNEADLKNKKITFENKASIAPLFETSGITTGYYTGQNFWSLLALTSSDVLELISYENIKGNYTDKGLLPLYINWIATDMGLSAEALTQLINTQLDEVLAMLMTGNEKIDLFIVDLAKVIAVMLDKPGSINYEAKFKTPYALENILTNPPTDFEGSISATEGTKTIVELTPEILLKK